MREFKLSEKIEENDEDTMEEFELSEDEKNWIYLKDVKEFIRLLKETLILDDYAVGSPRGEDYYLDIIDKLAGDLK